MKKILTILGARPQFIKAAPVSWALKKHGFSETIVHTGQHFDANMSNVFFDELKIPEPDYRLHVGGASPLSQVTRILGELEGILNETNPDLVIVYGDTNTTLAGALAANITGHKLVHIEAGLRSWNREMPEEINRTLTDHTADYFICPSQAAVQNLHAEGIQRPIYSVGDTMFDVVLFVQERAKKSDIIAQYSLSTQVYFLATLHRPYNVDNPDNLFQILSGLNALDMRVILPLHPRTANRITKNKKISGLKDFPNITFIDPVGIINMVCLMDHAELILTDSGGVQKEALFLNTPCVTIRSETEWVETVASGWNILCEPTPTSIKNAIAKQLNLKGHAPHLYGDGSAGEQIAHALKDVLKNK